MYSKSEDVFLDREDSNGIRAHIDYLNRLDKDQLILNPVENVPRLDYLQFDTSLLYGIYNSDKVRNESQKKSAKIQFAGRDIIAEDINLVYDKWKMLLRADELTMRFFSGMHAHTTVFMALTNIGDTVVILPEKAGGHMATKSILERLGLHVLELSVDYESMRVDINKSLELIKKVLPVIIFVDRSEGLIYEDFEWLKEIQGPYKIFDASQYLTNIIAKDYTSPFDMGFDAILSTTHKNFPGPQRALFCTKTHDELWERLYRSIGTYVSNMHPYAVYSLGLMAEQIDPLMKLSARMLENALHLSLELKYLDFPVVEQVAMFETERNTHHVWIKCEDANKAYDLYQKWESYGFLTNYRLLPYNLGYGIRLGLSAASYCGLTSSDIPILAQLMKATAITESHDTCLQKKCIEFIHRIKERSQ